MLPQNLHSSYLQYKLDTNHITSWLATTAQRCGFALKMQTVEEWSNPNRPKGRARMLPTQAAQEEPQPHAGAVVVNDFLPMAQKIMAFERPPVQVPDSFVRILDRAISLRKAVAFGQGNHGGTEPSRTSADRRSDMGHSFFTRTLEEVREVLKPRMSTAVREGTKTTQSTTTEDIAAANLTNMFSILDLEEPSEAFQESTLPSARKQKPQKPQKRFQAASGNDLEEATLGLICLLADFAQIRTVVSETWMGYKAGLFDLVSASITTNTAMELARGLEEAQQKLFTSNGGLKRVLDSYFSALCATQGQDPDSRELPGDDLNFAMYDVADSLYLPTFMLLDEYLGLYKGRSVPSYKPGSYGVYDASADRSKMSDREKYREDKTILLEILPDFHALARARRSMPGFDELTRGLCEALRSRQISLYLCFSTQIFLDIHHILRELIVWGLEDLRWVSGQIYTTVEATLWLRRELGFDWPTLIEEGLAQVIADLNSMFGHDMVREARVKIGVSRRSDVGKHRLQRNHPVLCGLYIYRIKSKSSEAGIKIGKASGSTVLAAHLYNALRQEKLLTGVWNDMELLVALQGEGHLFAGKRSASGEQYYRSLCHASGLTAAMFARDRRPQITAFQPAGLGFVRSLETGAPVHQMFAPRYRDGEERTNMTTQDVEKIISKSTLLETDDVEEISQLGVEQHAGAGARSRVKKKRKVAQQITIPELLRTLRLSLQSEILEFSFDYHTMYRQCWALLRTIEAAIYPRVCDIFGVDDLEETQRMSFVVLYIFTMMSKEERLIRENRIHVLPSEVRTPARELLEIAAEQFNEMISAGFDGAAFTMLRLTHKLDSKTARRIKEICSHLELEAIQNDVTAFIEKKNSVPGERYPLK